MSSPNQAQIDVTIKLDPSSPNGVRFALGSSLLKDGRLVFDNNKKDGFDLDFKIVDPDNTGYLFPDDPKEAMFVKPVSDITEPCPDDLNDPCYWEEFEAKKPKNQNKTLPVNNKNKKKQLFKFSLWFTKTPSQPRTGIPFDPIGENQNGPVSFFSLAVVAVALGTAIVALFAFYKLGWLGQ